MRHGTSRSLDLSGAESGGCTSSLLPQSEVAKFVSRLSGFIDPSEYNLLARGAVFLHKHTKKIIFLVLTGPPEGIQQAQAANPTPVATSRVHKHCATRLTASSKH